jgi:hypothetical protein
MSERRDPWAGEQMSRSDAQRRYFNLVLYQLRPMVYDRRLTDDQRIQILKRIIQRASRFRYESGVVAGGGTREEVADLLSVYLKPDAPTSEELREWIKRTVRAFGGTLENVEE